MTKGPEHVSISQAQPETKRIQLAASTDIRYIDDVFDEIFDAYGMPRLGGASGRGWSTYSKFQQCPHFFKLNVIDRRRGTPAKALTVGSVFHTFMALHYTWMVDPDLKLDPYTCKDELLQRGADVEGVLEGWRLYEAYADYYVDDYLYPLGVEVWAGDPEGHTCRYDLIARVDKAQAGIAPGVYNVDHKTASRFDAGTLDGWHNDGEIIGQMMIWKRSGLTKKYGKLMGSIINIVGKQKEPRFHRTIVPIQKWHARQHFKDLQTWDMFMQICQTTGTWPKSRNSCVTRYGLCRYFDYCSENKLPPKTSIGDAVTDALAERAIATAKKRAKDEKAAAQEETPERDPKKFVSEEIAVTTESVAVATETESKPPTNGVR